MSSRISISIKAGNNPSVTLKTPIRVKEFYTDDQIKYDSQDLIMFIEKNVERLLRMAYDSRPAPMSWPELKDDSYGAPIEDVSDRASADSIEEAKKRLKAKWR